MHVASAVSVRDCLDPHHPSSLWGPVCGLGCCLPSISSESLWGRSRHSGLQGAGCLTNHALGPFSQASAPPEPLKSSLSAFLGFPLFHCLIRKLGPIALPTSTLPCTGCQSAEGRADVLLLVLRSLNLSAALYLLWSPRRRSDLLSSFIGRGWLPLCHFSQN